MLVRPCICIRTAGVRQYAEKNPASYGFREAIYGKKAGQCLKMAGKVDSEKKDLLINVPFTRIAVVTVLLPLSAFVFCILYSYFYHHEWTTHTHCNVWNMAPSISAAIGVFKPQKFVWKMLVALHSAPRLLLAVMYRSLFKKELPLKRWIWSEVAFGLNVIEVLALLMLSFAPSRQVSPEDE